MGEDHSCISSMCTVEVNPDNPYGSFFWVCYHPRVCSFLELAVLDIELDLLTVNSAIFVLLLLHGIYEFIRSPYWQKISRKFPSGEISFTIKFNSAARSDSEVVVQEAMSAPTGQGPVHI